jgi:hypothetical protein
VQVNIKTLDKAEVALKEWVQRGKEVGDEPPSDPE